MITSVFQSLRVTSSVLITLTMVGTSLSAELTGRVVDADTGKILPVRLYIQSTDGRWYFASSTSSTGSAVVYSKQRGKGIEEQHVTLSADPFQVELPPGTYRLTAERGKEYLTATSQIEIDQQPVTVTLKLKRWIDMSQRGWYSGDTHVHRALADLPNIQLAEDLNVAFPLSFWAHKGGEPPQQDKQARVELLKPEVVTIDKTHLYYPMNTEYEIGTVGGKRHTLGAFFVLNHQQKYRQGVPPVLPIAQAARKQGAILELDKHNWPWSMMLVPIMQVDLFELTNNHIWRTNFKFSNWFENYTADYMNIEKTAEGFTERGWIDFGFQNYYALLNCGFRMNPTAGTASGVHPVPLGFGRVYVRQPDRFTYARWINSLAAGDSFITTGPMLMVKVNGQPGGTELKTTSTRIAHITGNIFSARPLSQIDLIVNGEVVQQVTLQNIQQQRAILNTIDVKIDVVPTSWVAVRCFEQQPRTRIRFAHSSPVWFVHPQQPIRPRRVEIQYLIQRIQGELARHQGVLDEASLAEYRRALKIYQKIAKQAR